MIRAHETLLKGLDSVEQQVRDDHSGDRACCRWPPEALLTPRRVAVANWLGYVDAWAACVHHHHSIEEKVGSLQAARCAGADLMLPGALSSAGAQGPRRACKHRCCASRSQADLPFDRRSWNSTRSYTQISRRSLHEQPSGARIFQSTAPTSSRRYSPSSRPTSGSTSRRRWRT